jgi:hypothetical protein
MRHSICLANNGWGLEFSKKWCMMKGIRFGEKGISWIKMIKI